ncbi:amidase [Streptomyces sp. Rer75]|uniref:amidase family protein n=1 Tax=Streptomyces sp. Rer75 TaxID=2750011 RepID=UPI00211F00F0|nr:amidase [Streptomyces sp. Rer75]
MTTPATMDAYDQADLVRRGETSPRELVEAAIERIEATDPRINAVTHRRYERALAEADRVRRDAPFAGVPTLTKSLSDSEGDPATFGCAWVARHGRVAREDSVINQRLKEAGFIVVGQTSAPEFGLLSVSESRLHGVTRNPWRTDVTPGGSSGGASAPGRLRVGVLAHAPDHAPQVVDAVRDAVLDTARIPNGSGTGSRRRIPPPCWIPGASRRSSTR